MAAQPCTRSQPPGKRQPRTPLWQTLFTGPLQQHASGMAPTDHGSSRERVPKAAAGDRTPSEPGTAAVYCAVPCHAGERCSGAARAMLTHLHSLCSLPSWLCRSPATGGAAHPRVALWESPCPLDVRNHRHTPIPAGIPCSHPCRPTASSATSTSLIHHLRFLARSVLGSFFLFFFFPPNLVSIETRLAEGEIKQPHVTQIPTLKNLPVVLAGVLHNHESAGARPAGPGSDGGTGLGQGGPGSAAEGPPGRRQQCLGLTSAGFGLSVALLMQ